jgi:hypothetical protein
MALPPIVPYREDVFAEDLVLGVMRYGQNRRVATYPNFQDESWHLFLRCVLDYVPDLIPDSLQLEFVPFENDRGDRYLVLREHEHVAKILTALARIDRTTGRMHLDLAGRCGVRMTESFPALLDAAYMIGWRINKFYEFIS